MKTLQEIKKEIEANQEVKRANDAANAKAHELNEIAVEGLKWRDGRAEKCE